MSQVATTGSSARDPLNDARQLLRNGRYLDAEREFFKLLTASGTSHDLKLSAQLELGLLYLVAGNSQRGMTIITSVAEAADSDNSGDTAIPGGTAPNIRTEAVKIKVTACFILAIVLANTSQYEQAKRYVTLGQDCISRYANVSSQNNSLVFERQMFLCLECWLVYRIGPQDFALVALAERIGDLINKGSPTPDQTWKINVVKGEYLFTLAKFLKAKADSAEHLPGQQLYQESYLTSLFERGARLAQGLARAPFHSHPNLPPSIKIGNFSDHLLCESEQYFLEANQAIQNRGSSSATEAAIGHPLTGVIFDRMIQVRNALNDEIKVSQLAAQQSALRQRLYG